MGEELRWSGDVEILAEQAEADAEGFDSVGAGVQNVGPFVNAFPVPTTGWIRSATTSAARAR